MHFEKNKDKKVNVFSLTQGYNGVIGAILIGNVESKSCTQYIILSIENCQNWCFGVACICSSKNKSKYLQNSGHAVAKAPLLELFHL